MSEFGEFFKVKFPNIQATIDQTHSEESILLKKACRMIWNARQKEIDQLKVQLNSMEQCYIVKKKQVNAVEHVLGCAIIGPKEVFAYASLINEALRVSDDQLLNR